MNARPSSDLNDVTLPPFWSRAPILSRRSRYRQIYRDLVFRLVYAIARLFLLLGVDRSRRLALVLGKVGYRLIRRTRCAALRNLDIAFGDSLTETERREIAKRSFENVALGAAETIWMTRWKTLEASTEVEIEGREYLEKALADKRGAILVTGHFGNWEMGLGAVVRKGYPICIVGRPLKDPRMEGWLRRIREVGGTEIILRGEGSLQIIRALRRGKAIGVMIDLDTRSGPGVFVDFFGRPAYTQVGPYGLARAVGAPILPVLSYRESVNKTRVVFGEPWEAPNTGNKEQDLLAATQKATRYFEERIRERPEQWTWFHNRWKTTPEKIAQRGEGRTFRSEKNGAET